MLCRRSSERIHEEPGSEEHADGQQDDSEVGEHSRVHRAGVSGHSLEFLQPQHRDGADTSMLNKLNITYNNVSRLF